MENREIDLFFDGNGLKEHVHRMVGPQNSHWEFQCGVIPLFIQTQENANRMRIVARIVPEREMERRHLIAMLEANYHSALDARYALADDWVTAAFIHPLHELNAEQFVLGLYQVVSCAATFGQEYTGGTMVFGRIGGDGVAKTAESRVAPMLDALIQGIRQQD